MPSFTYTSQDEIERLTNYMPIIVRSGSVTDWERKFCASVISRTRSGNSQPTEKQIAIMHRIVNKFQADTAGTPDADDDWINVGQGRPDADDAFDIIEQEQPT